LLFSQKIKTLFSEKIIQFILRINYLLGAWDHNHHWCAVYEVQDTGARSLHVSSVKPKMEVAVLLEIESSRKESFVERNHLVFVIEEELGKVGKDGILAYFSCEKGHQSSTKEVYILQRWAAKWEAYVDVTDIEQIKDGDSLTVIPQNNSVFVTSPTSSSAHLNFDTSQGQVC